LAFERLAYPDRPWTPGAHPLEEKKTAGLGRATLLRFRPGFADPQWCENGHAAFVLEGRLSIELEDGVHRVAAGEGFVVEPGTPHRAANAGTADVLVFVASYDANAAAVSSSR
jgi:quercetin dioxygenase-like cupin family protein